MTGNSRRILVLGHTGLLGASITLAFRDSSFQVEGMSRSARHGFQGDATDEAQLLGVLHAYDPDIVINLIADTDVDACQEDMARAFVTNVRPAAHVARWLRARGSGFLIHFSSDQVYSGSGPHQEDSVWPINAYALTKLLSESEADPHRNIILRTNFFGKSKCEGKVSFSDWLYQRFNDREPFNIFHDVRFSPLHMDTLCSVVRLIVDKPRAGIYNVASRQGISKHEFAIYMAEAIGLPTAHANPASCTSANFRAPRPHDMVMDSSRFRATYGLELPCIREEIDRLRNEYA